jgi:hypothetical protein
MAEEIKIPCNFWPSRTSAAYYDVVTEVTNIFNPAGVVLPTGVSGTVLFEACSVVPDDVNVTPAGQLWIYWSTASADTSSTITLTWGLSDIPTSTTGPENSLDPAVWESTSSISDSSAGAYIPNRAVVNSLTACEFLAGRDFIGSLTRSTDALAASIVIHKILLVMDVT